jgi:hypothetical protein
MFPRVVTIAVLVSALAGCGLPKDYEPPNESKRTLFMPSVRTAAPEPVYARTRWVLPPEVLPVRELPQNDDIPSETPSLRPVYHLKLKGSSLEETGRVLGAMARYSSYVAPSIAKNKISIENIGTLDELARIIEREGKVKVVVDHENREVRLLSAHAEAPRLLSE